ncbi:MAG: T9SS type A sorting domain-containing protein [Flavipsychrobacter sp.]
MKKTILLGIAMLCTQLSFGQYIPASAPENFYHSIVPSSCSYNDVGTDTRDASGSSIFGYGSANYLNYLNVTVNSCRDVTLLAPTFNWQSSAGTSGTLALPNDAEDPDVVLVSPMTSNAVWAIVVYYSASLGGYGMSYSQFMPGPWNFPGMSVPTLIYPYTPSPGYEPHINIDSDNMGHYAVVMQDIGSILSMTQTVTGVPPAPANPLWFSGLIEPDVAYNGNSSHEVTVIGLTNSRNYYRTMTRDYAGTVWYSVYNSAFLPELYQPRIATPSSGLTNDYAITVGRKYPVGVNVHFDILFQVNEGALNVANDGSMAGYPAGINVNNNNIFPCLTYAYTGVGTNEQISMGWYTDAIAGAPNQANTFIGLDVSPVPPYTCSTPGSYMDITNMWQQNNESVMAISGRYSNWSKSAAFTYSNAATPSYASRLIWKIQNTGTTNWKPTGVQNVVSAPNAIDVVPNPASDKVNINIADIKNAYDYEIYNQLGQLMQKGMLQQQSNSIDISNWASGVYIMKMSNTATHDMTTVQFVKQ